MPKTCLIKQSIFLCAADVAPSKHLVDLSHRTALQISGFECLIKCSNAHVTSSSVTGLQFTGNFVIFQFGFD